MSREFSCLSSSHEKIQTKINSNGLVPNNVTCSGIKSHFYGAVKTKYLRSCHDDKNRGVSFSRNFRSPLVCDGQGWQADQPSIPPRVFLSHRDFQGKFSICSLNKSRDSKQIREFLVIEIPRY